MLQVRACSFVFLVSLILINSYLFADLLRDSLILPLFGLQKELSERIGSLQAVLLLVWALDCPIHRLTLSFSDARGQR